MADGKFFNTKGGKLIADTNAHSANCYGFLVISEASISAITLDSSESESTNAYTSTTFPSGLFVPVHFSSITLTSGAIKALHL